LLRDKARPDGTPFATRRRRWVWGLGVATVTASAAFGLASYQAGATPTPAPTSGVAAEQPRVTDPSPGPEPVTGKGNDPLTATEVDKAKTVALTPSLIASAKDVTGAAGPEYLSSEIVEETSVRKAAIYFYDYRDNSLVKQVVDLGTGKVSASFAATGMQPPASSREVSTALDLLLADRLGAELRDVYTRATGRPWSGKEDLTVGAHVYQARPADTGAAQCGKHRCLQLVVQVTGGPYIDINDIIIDLSGRTVARLT